MTRSSAAAGVLILAVLAAAGPGRAEPWESLESPDVSVRFAGPSRGAAAEVARVYPKARLGLEGVLPWKLNIPTTILLAHDKAAFRERAGNDLTLAIAVPGHALIILDAGRMAGVPGSLEGVLRHELCHLLLHERIPEKHLPRWLDEGVCQWASNGVTELLTAGRAPRLEDAAISRRLLPLARLADTFPDSHQGLILAYEQGRSFVDFLVTTYGRGRFLELLERLRGDDVEISLRGVYGVSLDELESQWQTSLMKRFTWITFLSSNLYEILFFGAALLVIAGALRLFLRRRSRPEEDDDQDTTSFYPPRT
jgi:hypothetical protein